MMADGQVLAWLRAVHPQTRFTTSVCSGSLILAAAGLLEGVPATTHWVAMPMLRRFGAEPRPDARVVQHGKIYTAAGVSAGIDLALELLAAVDGEDAARTAQLMMEYDPQPPFDTGHVSKADPATIRRARSRLTRAALTPSLVLALPKILLARWKHALAG